MWDAGPWPVITFGWWCCIKPGLTRWSSSSWWLALFDRFSSEYVIGTFLRIKWSVFVQILWWYFLPLQHLSLENGKKGSFKFLLLSGFVCPVIPDSVLLFQMCETECLVFGLLISNALSWCWIVEIPKGVVKRLVLNSVTWMSNS